MSRGAFGYIRVSGPTQAKDDRDGFPRQKQTIREWAKANNVRIIKIFKDILPGKTPLEERPGMQTMLGALLADGIKLVVIEKLERLSRKLTIQEGGIAYMKSKGFEIVSATEPDLFDDDPMRTAMRQMMGVFAELDARMIVRKLRGAKERARASKPGYKEGPKFYGARDGELAIIAEIIELRNNGLTVAAICEQLNSKGKKSRRGGKWFPNQIVRILQRAGV